MEDSRTYFYKKMPNTNFCVDIFLKDDIKCGENFKTHWHEHLQLYYFVGGRAILECGSNRFEVSPDNVAVVNSNELHYLESLSDDLKFYVIRIDPTFLFSNQVDLLQTKYFAPLAQNRIAFKNLIESDAQVLNCVTKTIQEYFTKETGYELAVKASIYQLIVQLLRGYVGKILTKNEFEEKARSLKRFNSILHVIENNYSERIHLKELADTVNLSVCHFCRTFKQITGKTMTDYVNGVRLEKATYFLEQTDLNITEIALRCGFDSVNYFSRLFRKYYNTSATEFRETHTEQFST